MSRNMSEVQSQIEDFERHFENLASQVRTTHAQFEELLHGFASTRPDSQDSERSCTPTPTKPALPRYSPRYSHIVSGLLHLKPLTVPDPFLLLTEERATKKRGTPLNRSLMRDASSLLRASRQPPQGLFSRLRSQGELL